MRCAPSRTSRRRSSARSLGRARRARQRRSRRRPSSSTAVISERLSLRRALQRDPHGDDRRDQLLSRQLQRQLRARSRRRRRRALRETRTMAIPRPIADRPHRRARHARRSDASRQGLELHRRVRGATWTRGSSRCSRERGHVDRRRARLLRLPVRRRPRGLDEELPSRRLDRLRRSASGRRPSFGGGRPARTSDSLMGHRRRSTRPSFPGRLAWSSRWRAPSSTCTTRAAFEFDTWPTACSGEARSDGSSARSVIRFGPRHLVAPYTLSGRFPQTPAGAPDVGARRSRCPSEIRGRLGGSCCPPSSPRSRCPRRSHSGRRPASAWTTAINRAFRRVPAPQRALRLVPGFPRTTLKGGSGLFHQGPDFSTF